jgi:hypothetical protein
MASKKCVDCGAPLAGLNSIFDRRCVDCYRIPYQRAKAFLNIHLLQSREFRVGNFLNPRKPYWAMPYFYSYA